MKNNDVIIYSSSKMKLTKTWRVVYQPEDNSVMIIFSERRVSTTFSWVRGSGMKSNDAKIKTKIGFMPMAFYY